MMKTKHLPNLRKTLFHFLLFLVMMTGFIISGNSQTVVTNPASPWTVPTGVTSIKVEAWGGGGGGGGAYIGAGGGGGGGAYNTTIFTVAPGQTYNITRGGGGTVGSNANGGNGGQTTVSGPAGTLTANGGFGGSRGSGSWIFVYLNDYGDGGAGGTGGQFNGGAGGSPNSNGAGGGGAAGNNANGGAGGNATTGTGGAGNPNTSPYIGGNGGAFITNNNNGNSGIAPGGGGGGARSRSDNNSRSGGAGAAGQVVITYTVCIPPTAYSVTGSGTYCVGAAGRNVGLSNSETGVTYQLKLNGNNNGTPVSGTGGALDFGIKTAGTYTVVATRTSGGCTSNMTGSAVVIQNTQVVATVGPLKNISCYAGNDGEITVSASGGQSPYTFSIDNGTSYYPATGTDLRTFTGLMAGVEYKIRVKDALTCESPILP